MTAEVRIARMDATEIPDLMTVSEVADYLRIRQRRVDALVRMQPIPFSRLSGKLLFPGGSSTSGSLRPRITPMPRHD
jgi:putative molybdopterin biosynthesis protein